MDAEMDWSGLEKIIAEVEAGGSLVGVGVVAPSGAVFGHRAERRFRAASTVKINVMIELLRQVDAGRLSLGTLHRLVEEDRSGGSGILLHLHVGLEVTLGDLAYLMMAISDNSATNMLIDHVGMEAVNATMRSLGMTGSVLGRKARGRPAQPGEGENWAVPGEYAATMRAILDGTAASAAGCAAMVGLLEKQQNDRRLARHLPVVDRPRWGSKTGSLPGVVNDVGFVMTERGPVVMAVFVEVEDALVGEAVIGEIGRAVLAAVG